MMKYLVFEDFSGQAVPFLFPDRVDHVDMRDQLPYGRVLGAGDVSIDGGRVTCSGGVSELGVVSRGEVDADIIARQLL